MFVYPNSMPFYARLKAVLSGYAPDFRLKDELMVRNRLGAKPILLSLSLVLCAWSIPGCASAPINMRGAQERSAVVEQVELRGVANALADRLDQAGWAVSATPAEATRSFFNRLIGGGDRGEASPRTDPVMAYLAVATTSETVEADIIGLIEETDAVSAQALGVADSETALGARTLANDLAAVERALGAVRRAADFFQAVLAQGEWDDASSSDLETRLEAVRAAETRLAASADVLAERRWAVRSGLFS